MVTKMKEKILVLITAQKSAMRLIDYGYTLASALGGELHILHVQKGNSVFDNFNTLAQLNSIIKHGTKLGGNVHIHCQQNVAEYIGNFVDTEAFTQVVVGETHELAHMAEHSERTAILNALPKTAEVHEVAREEVMILRLIG